MALTKINVRSPYYLLADPITTTTTEPPQLTEFTCSDAGFTMVDGTTGNTIVINTDATVSAGTLNSVDPSTYQDGVDQTYTANITVPSGYTNSGETLTTCTATATGTETTFPPTTQAPGCTEGGITLTQSIADASVDYGNSYILNTALYFSSSGNLSYTVTTLPSDQELVSISQIGGYITFTTNTSQLCGDVKINIIASDDIGSCDVSDTFRLTVANCPTTTTTSTTTQPSPSNVSFNSTLTQAVGENPSYQISYQYTTLINNIPVVKTSTHTLPINGSYNFTTLANVISDVTASVTRTSPDNTVADSTTILFSRNLNSAEQTSTFTVGEVVSGESHTFTSVADNDAFYVDISEG